MRALDISLYLASPLVLVALIVIFLKRRLIREFPFFFVYMLYGPVTTALRISVAYHPQVHFWLYWSTETGYDIFALLALREVLRRLFSMAHAAYRWLRWLLPVGVPTILGFTVLETFYHHPLENLRISPWIGGIYWFDLGVHVLEGLILLLVLALTFAIPVSWIRQEFGILAGFGLNAYVTVIAFLYRFELGRDYETFYRYGPPAAYLVATLVWLHVFFHSAEPDQRDPEIGPDDMLGEVKRAREGLTGVKRVLGLRCRSLGIPV